jgi:nicotinamidase/pyrazinamidase
VRDVYVMGLATDYCVKATVLDAKRLGFNTYMIEDGCRGVELTPGDTKLAIERIRDAGVRVVRSHQI